MHSIIETIQTEGAQESIEHCANHLVTACHELAAACGWWNIAKPNTPTMLMLTVSELAEAMEADRKNLNDDHLPHRPGLEVELADAVIRIFDMAGGLKLDLGAAIAEKLAYNANRQDHKPENRAKQHGKKY